jgi:hypothetical protein
VLTAVAGAAAAGILTAGPARPAAAASLAAPVTRPPAAAVITTAAVRPADAGAARQDAAPAAPAVPAGCGFFDVACQVGQAIGHAIDSWFAGLVTAAVNPLFGLLGQTLLSTPQVGGIGTVRSLWSASAAIADACYVLLVLIGGIIVMSHQTLQTSYAVKDIAPRLVVGFVAANLSLLLAGKAIGFADAMSAAIAGQGLDPAAAGQILRNLIYNVLASGSIFFILLAVFAVALVVILTVIYVARLMVTVLLIAMAPLALACHALPQTEGAARWWWRAFGGVLAIQAAQALVLVASARIFFSDGWAALIAGRLAGHAAATTLNAVQLICVLYLLVRIPFWISRRVWHFGPSPARTAVRYAFGALVLSRITPALRGTLPARPAPRSRGTRP